MPIAAKRPGVNNPTVARRGDLRAGRAAMERPFWVPPTPSEAPNSRIFTPLTGKRRCPRVDAKATAGDSRPGSLECREVGPGGVFLDRTGARVRGAGGGIESRFELGDQVLEAVDLAGQIGRRAVRSAVERLLRSWFASSAARRSANSCATARGRASRDREPAARVRRRCPCGRAPGRRDRRRALRPARACPAASAPSVMAVRTACSASSGWTRSAGGG